MKHSRRRFLEMSGATTVAMALNSVAFPLGAATEKTKIGIIGSGKVGGALGSAWAKAGHEVMFSSRNLADDKALAGKVGANARAGTTQEAAAFGQVLLMAVPYRALPDVGKELAAQIKGKIIIDACNPFVERDGEIATQARNKGPGLMSAELLPGARIVRAFNAVGYTRMASAHEEPGRIGMPFASDDAEAIKVATRLIGDAGFEPVLIGGLAMGKYLMPGTPLAGEHTPEEIKRIVATLK